VHAAGDWLQGPYVYALYQHYGFDRGDIGRLFIAGFGSSMIFGTIVGSLADKTCALHLRTAAAAVHAASNLNADCACF
jgi:Sugar-tranasporters, 12 TM